MFNNTKNRILTTLVFAIYCCLALLFLNPFKLTNSENSSLAIATIGAAIFGLAFLIISIANKLEQGIAKQIIKLGAFATSPVAAAIMGFCIFNQSETSLPLFISSFLIISILPVAVVILIIIFDDVKGKIHVSIQNSETTETEVPTLKIANSKGKVLINVEVKNVLCFEANDNYVVIYHLDESNAVKKSMERISLKKIEELLDGIDVQFKRVHKSYLINHHQINQIQGKSQAYRIQLNQLEKEIPVSRNFDISGIKA